MEKIQTFEVGDVVLSILDTASGMKAQALYVIINKSVTDDNPDYPIYDVMGPAGEVITTRNGHILFEKVEIDENN